MIKEFIGIGESLEEATQNAIEGLAAKADEDVQIEVLSEYKKKVLGVFGGTPAKVRAFVELPDPKPKKVKEKKEKVEKKAPIKEAKPVKEEVKSEAPENLVDWSVLDPASSAGKAAAYVSIMSIPSDEMLEDSVAQAMDGVDREAVETILADSLTAEMGLDREEVEDYLADMEEEELMDIYREGVEMQVKAQYAAGVAARMAAVPRSYLAAYLDSAMEDYTAADCAKFYDEVLVFSEATYEDNLVKLGCLDLADPSAINLYAASF